MAHRYTISATLKVRKRSTPSPIPPLPPTFFLELSYSFPYADLSGHCWKTMLTPFTTKVIFFPGSGIIWAIKQGFRGLQLLQKISAYCLRDMRYKVKRVKFFLFHFQSKGLNYSLAREEREASNGRPYPTTSKRNAKLLKCQKSG